MRGRTYAILIFPVVLLLVIAQSIWNSLKFLGRDIKENAVEAYELYKEIWQEAEKSEIEEQSDFWNAQ